MIALHGSLRVWGFACIAALSFTQYAFAVPYCDDPTQPGPGENCAPCLHATRVAGNSLVNGIDEEELAILFKAISTEAADLDGVFSVYNSGSEFRMIASGDEMRDISSQMNVLITIIKNPSRFPDGSLLPSAGLSAAYQHNFNVIRNEKFGNNVASVLEIFIKDLFPLLTYYSLLGREDDFVNIIEDDPVIVNGRGALGILQALFIALDGYELSEDIVLDFLEPVIAPNDFITVGNLIGPDGDLDADGYNNICEYRHFRKYLCSLSFPNPAPHVNGTIDYLTAALDPEIVPIGCFEVEAFEDECKVNLLPDALVPQWQTDDFGQARFRRLENTVTGAERYQVNIYHTMHSANSSAAIISGIRGETELTTILAIPDASSTFGEVYLTPELGQAISAEDPFIEVTGKDLDTGDIYAVIRADSFGNCKPHATHTADESVDGALGLGELLGVIQFYNAESYHCDGVGGYLLGSGDVNCKSHSADYLPEEPDFRISLGELLRNIQIFSAGHYYLCTGEASEDGYCLGQP